MIFASSTFLIVFLPSAILALLIFPPRFRSLILLVFSLVFYAYGEIRYGLIMVFSIFLDYTCGIMIESSKSELKRKAWLAISVIGNLGLLGWFKYSGYLAGMINDLLQTSFPIPQIILPLGISFFTFQTMSYSIDVYRNDVKAERSLIDFAAYVSMFPQLIAGPIVRYSDISVELKNPQDLRPRLEKGFNIFIIGLGSKVLLANALAAAIAPIEALSIINTSRILWIIQTLYFGFQLYFDFAGYSLMAIGLGYMFGFTFPQNFNHPYISTSVSEFFRRWHMTLGDWFRSYLYIPLGGSRVSLKRLVANLLVVWFITGLWHGADHQFVVWGLWLGLWVILEKLWLHKINLPTWFRHSFTLLIIFMSWSIFNAPSLSDWSLRFIQASWLSPLQVEGLLLRGGLGLLVLSIVFSGPWISTFFNRLPLRLQSIVYTLILGLSVASLIHGSLNPFLYFRF
jgi:alginate O-acetyltransferase complex protein AlgI